MDVFVFSSIPTIYFANRAFVDLSRIAIDLPYFYFIQPASQHPLSTGTRYIIIEGTAAFK